MYFIVCYDQEAPQADLFYIIYVYFKLNHYMMVINFTINELGWGSLVATNLAVIPHVLYIHRYSYFKAQDLGTVILDRIPFQPVYTLPPPHILLKETPKKGSDRRYKIVAIVRINQFEFFNWIWATFWWGIKKGESFIGGMFGKIKMYF